MEVWVLNGQGGADYQVSKNIAQCLTAATMSSGNNKIVCVYAIDGYNQTLMEVAPCMHSGSKTDVDHVGGVLIKYESDNPE